MMPLYHRKAMLLATLVVANLLLAGVRAAQTAAPNGTEPAAAASEPLPAIQEFLADNTPETRQKVLDLLAGNDSAAQLAIAKALGAAPERMSHHFRTELAKLLRADSNELRLAAAQALLADRDPAGFQPIREYLTDPSQPASDRLTVLRLLSDTTSRVAVGTLVDLAREEKNPTLRSAAFELLETIAQTPFQNKDEALQSWWVISRQLSDEDWMSEQLARLNTERRSAQQRVSELEARLILTLRNSYRTADENTRLTMLESYLADDLPAVQELGLSLVQALLTDGRQLSETMRARVRSLVNSPRATTRQLAIQTIAGMRDETDAARFLAMLDQETDENVRVALVNALGYLGNDHAVTKLTELAAHKDGAVRLEALTGLGRLSERGKISDAQRDVLIETLRQTFAESQDPDDPKLRERTLWAMSRIAAHEFCANFTAALASVEPLEVRQAALYGIRTMADPGQAAVLAGALTEPDAALRRQIVELLAEWASTEQVDALFGLLDPEQEAAHEIRELAWTGIARLAAEQDPETLATWLTRLHADDPETPRRRRVLLAARAEQLRSGDHPLADRAAALQALADAHLQLSEPRLALEVKLERLTCCVPAEASDRGGEFAAVVTFALEQNLYDAKLAEQLRAVVPPPASDVVWLVMRSVIEDQLKASQVDQAEHWIELLRSQPPLEWPETVRGDFDRLLQQVDDFRLEQVKTELATALDTLSKDPNNAPARQKLLDAPALALPLVRERLAAALAAEQANPAYESALTELLQQLNPDWPGFAADMPREERRRALLENTQ